MGLIKVRTFCDNFYVFLNGETPNLYESFWFMTNFYFCALVSFDRNTNKKFQSLGGLEKYAS